MIRKQDILDRAAEWQLRPDVVEKDYVLGWLLAAVALNEEMFDTWVFKGGTCIKKCYFETYRFSEDLDFSLLPEAPYEAEEIRAQLLELTASASELSGVVFPEEFVEVKTRKNKQGQPTFQGKVAYRGPLEFAGTPKILFDITQHEPVLDAHTSQTVFHPYPDALPEGWNITTYSLHELVAEKTRALYERTRPRDLYDVVYLLENQSAAFDLQKLRNLFQRKCQVKGIEVPTADQFAQIAVGNEELRSEWENMLAHQLPVLPSLNDLLARLTALIRWIDEPAIALPGVGLKAPPVAAGQALYAPSGIQYSGTGQPLEIIRFAGMNRLLVEFDYHGRRRLVEPYSLRTAATGNLLFYAWELAAGHIKAFKIAEMMNIRVTSDSFAPRYLIEFTPNAFLSAPLTAKPTRVRSSSPRRASRTRTHTGPVYVFECQYCGKKFRHTTNNPKLGKHKAKDGDYNCPGRRGYLVDTRY
jgi:predicted nucleotidyltransferase component of viral defense system